MITLTTTAGSVRLTKEGDAWRMTTPDTTDGERVAEFWRDEETGPHDNAVTVAIRAIRRAGYRVSQIEGDTDELDMIGGDVVEGGDA